jgi:hypothetical protein
VASLATGETAEVVGASKQRNSGEEGVTTSNGTRYGGSWRPIRETYRLAKHDTMKGTLAFGGLCPNPAQSDRVSTPLVNCACHFRVRVSGSCQAGMETGLMVPVV